MKMAKEETSQHFNKRSVSFKKILVFFIWLTTGSKYKTASASRALTVQTGGSIVIPCYYDRKYTEYKKYWCSVKGYFISCSILAYANETKGKVSVIDHPDQSFFTVTMRNLQEKDTRAYWCAVEIGGFFQPDENEQFYLTVQSAPDVSVLSSSVSGHEGGNVSVQCFYSSGYQNNTKRWCRYKDQSCFTEKTDTSQSSSVQISDDGESSFTVLMTELRLSNSGWYFCSAGIHIFPVQLTVTKAESGTDNNEIGNKLLTVWLPVSAALALLLVLAVVFIWIWRWRPKQDDQKTRQRNNSSTTNPIYSKTEDPVIYSTINDETPNNVNNEITYSTIDNIPGSEAPPAGGLYSTVAPH